MTSITNCRFKTCFNVSNEPNSKIPSGLNQGSFMVHSWLAGSFHGSFKNGPRHLFTHPKNDRRVTISISNGIFNHLREQESVTRQLDLAIEVLNLFVGFYLLIFSLTFCSSSCALGSRNFSVGIDFFGQDTRFLGP